MPVYYSVDRQNIRKYIHIHMNSAIPTFHISDRTAGEFVATLRVLYWFLVLVHQSVLVPY